MLNFSYLLNKGEQIELEDNILLIPIIVPTRNSERKLKRVLRSIRNQTYKNIELIGVDNNSSDRTKEIARKYTDLAFNEGL